MATALGVHLSNMDNAASMDDLYPSGDSRVPIMSHCTDSPGMSAPNSVGPSDQTDDFYSLSPLAVQRGGSPGKAKRPRHDLSASPSSAIAGANGASTPELMRCKRRISFTQLGYGLPQAPPASVARRNERERNRVKLVNLGFATLRQHVPNGAKNKKMSKVETLHSAVEYIRQLQQFLQDQDAMSRDNLGPYPDSTSNGCSANENCYPRGPSAQRPVPHQQGNVSPACSLASSPTPSYASGSSNEPLSPEDEELLDFTSWFS